MLTRFPADTKQYILFYLFIFWTFLPNVGSYQDLSIDDLDLKQFYTNSFYG